MKPIDVDEERYGEHPAYHEGASLYDKIHRGEIKLTAERLVRINPYPEGTEAFYAFNCGWNGAVDRIELLEERNEQTRVNEQ